MKNDDIREEIYLFATRNKLNPYTQKWIKYLKRTLDDIVKMCIWISTHEEEEIW
jgi:hypothetical protein